MAGSNTLQMTGGDTAPWNQGRSPVGQAGLAAFVAPSVRNSGTINATVGSVALAAGTPTRSISRATIWSNWASVR